MKRILCVMLSVLLTTALASCGLTVPSPEVDNGEFDFSVTYEINGETKTVSGVYVCEYNGTDWALDGGYHRDWNGYVKGNPAEDRYKIGETDDGGDIYICLGVYPEYFMGDEETGGKEIPAPWITVQYPYDENGGVNIFNDATEIEESFGAKIISYNYAEPIENSFALFK